MDSNSDNNNIIDSLIFEIDKHLYEIRIGLATVALLSIGYAFKSVKPFTKFSKYQPIPQSFIEKNIKLNGRVVDVKLLQPTHSIAPVSNDQASSHISILVDHQPIFQAPFSTRPTSDPLAICLDSVAISEQGFATLYELLLNKPISFVLLCSCTQHEISHLSCIVYCQLPHTSRWQRLASRASNVAYHLVATGHASVTPSNVHLTLNNPLYKSYYQELLRLESQAEKKRLGIWASQRTDETFSEGQSPHKVSLWTKLEQFFKPKTEPSSEEAGSLWEKMGRFFKRKS